MKIQKLCKQISKELNIDYDTVYSICMYQFDFIKQVMQDEDDTHDILINKLFKFKLKSRFKENKQADYSPKKEKQDG